ncbi:hypothetical protein LIN78_09635 [Leeia sp. TBRC 13508]|uniref:Uncharacterized protein n=1 Tax=Leeia speluncae TaxID=2884804 RepID=A0ABS8D743_9NEIS|nr:DUF6707 family protein [Leeia speluncae]MCB6183806.1 hypothetical protein [Leeia speluncae]
MPNFVLDASSQQVLDSAKHLAMSHFNAADAETLEFAYQIAMYHFVLGQNETALSLLQPFSGISFSGDFNIWTFVEYALLLTALIAEQQQDEAGKENAVRAIYTAIESEEDPEGAKEFIAELCDRGAEYGAEIEEAIAQNDPLTEIWARVSQVIDWVYVAMHNRSTQFTHEAVLAEIASEQVKIVELVSKNGLQHVYPFSQIESGLH